eukprot:GHVT01081007.1.p2 GENE.GHVT01081007.1~~GHVT01081007.1.p2  ORF type:complete len:531 (+),score=29.62 GHVT01081007.1:196-1593(+)
MSDKIVGHKTSVIQDQLAVDQSVDAGDPIYDSETEDAKVFFTVTRVAADDYRQGLARTASYSTGGPPRTSSLSLDKFLDVTEKLLQEFYSNKESSEIGDRLKTLGCPTFYDRFVVQAIRTALDKTDADQKQLSALLTVLCDRKILTPQLVGRGLEKLVQSVDDLKLDVPSAADRVFSYIECAVEDGIAKKDMLHRLPECFVTSLSPNAITNSSIDVPCLLKELREYKADVRKSLPEFFNSGSVEETLELLVQLKKPYFRHEFVKILVKGSLEKSDAQRELVSNVLDVLYAKVLRPDDTQLGFSRLIADIEDVRLDTPGADEILTKFLARSVVDEILPPSFVSDNCRLHTGGTSGMAILKKCGKWLSKESGKATTVRFRKIWTGTDPDTIQAREFKHDIKDCIGEYFDSRDKHEACRLIKEMELTPGQVKCQNVAALFRTHIRRLRCTNYAPLRCLFRLLRLFAKC